MPKQVTIRARSKESLDSPDIAVSAKFPTIDEAIANPSLKQAFEHAAHATFAINLQSKLRGNATLEDKTKVQDPQKLADGIDYTTMGTRQRGGLTPNKISLMFGELGAAGDVAKIQQAIALNKAGNMVELEKFGRANCPKTFATKAKAAPKADAPAVAKK